VDSACLLSNPLSSSVRAEVRINRVTAKYQNNSQKFRNVDKLYKNQFYKNYSERLHAMEPMIIQQAKDKHGQHIQIHKISELREESQSERKENILVVGTVFKQEQNVPSILKEYAIDQDADQVNIPVGELDKFTSETDSLILEDDTMRVGLLGNIETQEFVNGVIIGVWGKEAKGGNFKVDEVILPKIPGIKTQGEEASIVVISGLELVGSENGEYLESLQLAADWICGSAGGPTDQDMASKVERVILAGNCLAESTMNKEDNTKAKYLTHNKEAGSIAAILQLDELMAQLAGSVSVDLVPGANDPASGILPQQPLHKCMFPQARAYPTFQSVTNPYSFNCGGREILVLGGQTVRDVMRNSDLTDPLEIMEKFVRWGHVAPTCPDTLGGFPTQGEDPHCILTLPDIFIAGNQDYTNWRKLELNGKEVLLVSVARFGRSKALVSIPLDTVEPIIMEFESLVEASSQHSSPEH